MKVAVLIGGISQSSINRRLFSEVEKLNDTSLRFIVADIASLPFYSQDIENDPPQSVAEFNRLIGSADAILIVTPEYNRSIPGVLKNALDWGSRPPGHNSWSGKPTAIMGASNGPLGTCSAQQHLRTICSQLNMPVMNQPGFLLNASTGMDENGLTEKTAGYVKRFLDSFGKWISLFSKGI